MIVNMADVFSPDNPVARQLSSTLLATSANVIIVSFPTDQESVAFAGNTLPFDRDSLSELLRANGKTEFIIFDTSLLKLLIDEKKPQ
jgi:hypothetical protein